MPGKDAVLNVISVVLQYTLVFLLYFFMYKVMRLVYEDLREPQPAAELVPTLASPRIAARLTVVNAGATALSAAVYPLSDSMTIGRGEHNDIVIPDQFVSHEHVCISRDKHGYWLSDLNSTNPALLNGRAVREDVLLEEGDLLQIGEVTFRFER